MALPLDERFAEIVTKESLFTREDPLLVAVSGGMDSMCLLQILSNWHKGTIEVAHMNYQLRGDDSDEDEKLVEEVCQELGLICHSTKSPLDASQSGIQEEARILRYQWLNELKNERKLKYILTAHHLDDQFETVLHHLLRGSGLNGLVGMDYRSDDLIRPLLSCSKSDIKAYQKANQVPYREDKSNLKSKYTRNFLRNEIMPLLHSHFEQLENSLGTSLRNLQTDRALLQNLLKEWVDNHVKSKNSYIHIPLNSFSDKKGRSSLIYHLTNGRLNTDEIRQLLTSDQTGTVIEKEDFSILKDRKDLIIRPFQKQEINLEIREAGTYDTFLGSFSIAPVEEIVFDQNPYSEYISTSKELFPLRLRNWQEGDHFTPLGMNEHRKKLSDLFIDEKIHQLEKEDIPLLVHKDQIVWVVGIRLSEAFKFRATDRYIYKLTFSKSSKDLRSQFFKYLF